MGYQAKFGNSALNKHKQGSFNFWPLGPCPWGRRADSQKHPFP